MMKRKYLRLVVLFALFLVFLCFFWRGEELSIPKYQPVQSGNRKNGFVVEYLDEKRLRLDANDTVIILTPLKNAHMNLLSYFEGLGKLTYPSEKISLGFLVSDSNDSTFELLSLIIENFLPKRYKRVTVITHDYDYELPRELRHGYETQAVRRSYMARARNYLLHRALQDERWVLWLDSDLVSYPSTLIEDLLKPRKQIIVPNCFAYGWDGELFVYDRNSWRETEESLELQRSLSEDQVLFEGYELKTHRRLLGDMYDKEGNKTDLVLLDGVGGTALLVDADLHRDGLVFPPIVLQHSIETEGLAKMAKLMGVEAYGLPNYVVIHLTEY